MAEIGVVVPSWKYWKDPIKLQPLWELYYATLIENRIPNATVEVIDLRNSVTIADNHVFIPEKDFYFYWIMKSADAHEIYRVVADLRQTYPKAVHIAGGNHVDRCQDECAPIFDVLLSGTAEESLVQVFHDLARKCPQKIYHEVNPCLFQNYLHPSRHYLPKDRIVNDKHFIMYGGKLGTGAYFSRGCGFRCHFCVYNNPGSFQYRTGPQITHEIEYLKREYGIQGVNLRDEVCLPVNKRLCSEYLEAIGRTGVIWRGQTATIGSEDMIRLARESGCQELAIGVESAVSDHVLELINKPTKSLAKMRSFIEMVKKYDIRVKVCLILGLPGEPSDVAEKTIIFIKEVDPDYVAVSALAPVPGSYIYSHPDQFGIKYIDQNWDKHAHLVYRFGDTENVGIPFEYEDQTPWGKALSRSEILENVKVVQNYLRENGKSY